MRLFVALDMPEATRLALGETIHKFESVCPGARWTRAESLHITLKFIGHVEEEKLAAIKRRLTEVHAVGPAEIAFRQFGFFPNERNPRVFWLGIEAGLGLVALAREIESHLEPLGIPREERAFRPHLTLVRFKSEAELPQLKQVLTHLGRQDFGRTVTTEYHLYESTLKASGAVHTRLASYRFLESETL